MGERDIAWVKKLDDAYLACRSMRHAWQLYHFENFTASQFDQVHFRVEEGEQLIQRRMTCMRCNTERIDLFVRSGKRTLNGFRRRYSRYIYPEGYTFKRAEHRLDTPTYTDFIVESFMRESK